MVDDGVRGYGLCECGCGERTGVPTKSNRSNGDVRGVPRRFRAGHNQAPVRPKVAKPCECGCGDLAKPGFRFLAGHRARLQPRVPIDAWHAEDRGYETPCWIWDRCRNSGGYGVHRDGLAHRVMWKRTHGSIPAHLEPDHLCRQPDCINPGHLELVPPVVNKQRSRAAKLTVEQVREIRDDPRTHRHIGAEYGVSAHQVWMIKQRRSWANVD